MGRSQHHKTCELCGRGYHTGAYRSKFCSQDCARANASIVWLRSQGRDYATAITYSTCGWCQSSFVVRHRQGAVYCSDACRNRDAECRVERSPKKWEWHRACRQCGEWFIAEFSGGRRAYFCSDTCRAARLDEYKHEYKQTEAYRDRHRKRRINRRGVRGSHTAAQWHALLDEHGGKCAYCRERKADTRDHIVPISRGGTDDIENIVPACRTCNCNHKLDRLPHEWAVVMESGQTALPVVASGRSIRS